MGHPTFPSGLVAIAIKRGAIMAEVALPAADFSLFMTRGTVVAITQIAAKFMTIMNDLRVVLADIAPQSVVSIPRESRRHSHSDQ
jgi:hypothetical protein